MKLTAARLHKLLHYNKRTGVFTWCVSRGSRRAGSAVVDSSAKRYIWIRVDGRLYSAARLAWLYVHGHWPPHEMDHKDRSTRNNKFSNLRPATCGQNCVNKIYVNGSAMRGVSRKGKRWEARLTKDQRTFWLGTHATKHAAHAAYMVAARKHHAAYARTK